VNDFKHFVLIPAISGHNISPQALRVPAPYDVGWRFAGIQISQPPEIPQFSVTDVRAILLREQPGFDFLKASLSPFPTFGPPQP
jgi:hypothetical protein